MSRTILIVGAGLTAASAIDALRKEGFDGAIVLVGDEPHLPYERPPLSKEYLRGAATGEQAVLHPADWYAGQGVQTRLGERATRVLPGERAVELDSGEVVRGDAVLLATGGRPRRLPRPDSDRVLYLRTLEDAERIAAHLGPGRRLVLIGAGFIGAEVAASARTVGTEVTVLEMLAVPLEHLLGKRMGAVIAELHRQHGVDLRTGQRVQSVTEAGDHVRVTTVAGDVLESGAVVVGIGTLPNSEIAEASGIVTGNGIVTDEFCRTSLDGVFAAGDVANHYHPLYERRLRVEHYDNAVAQGAAAARSILGRREAFTDPHWFWSDQYEHNLQYAGSVQEWDDLVLRGCTETRDVAAFYLHRGVLRAVFGINRGRDVRTAKRLIARGLTPDPDALRDPDTDLRSLLR
jgi:3-phenylpropionate/trans-cinnamate dioxygenase ferredoxin reductase subunit